MCEKFEYWGVQNMRNEELLKRTEEILLKNMYEPEGYPWSPYRCISPGKNRFPGIWNWDTAFHAIGMARIDAQIAKENVMGFFKFQRADGFLPDVIWEDGGVVDWLSKPPVFAWACERIYNTDGDVEFLKKIYHKLVLNADWWYKNRFADGLFFYDAENKESDEYIQSVKYESGWDNSVRWDSGITNKWAIDLNCFMVMFMRSMCSIASKLDLSADCALWQKKAAELERLINDRLWDEEHKYYADADRNTGEVSDVLTPASFMPLFVKIAPAERAEHMKALAETRFRKKMPTVVFDNPEYSNDYWRGPTWLNTAYFAVKGLENYNFAVADEMREGILDMCAKNFDGIYENYDSITGSGLCCDRFSWSCVFIRELILDN